MLTMKLAAHFKFTKADPCLSGSSVHGVLQARILEWIAIPFSGDLSDPGTEPGPPALKAVIWGLALT